MTMVDPQNAGYQSYHAWKGWDNPFTCPPALADYYAAEFAGIALHGARLLEIGFGNGEFLAWASEQGAVVAGSEITSESIAAAKTRGLTLVPPDFEDGPTAATTFDIIVAFDVFEHLPVAAITAKLSAIAAMLSPGGWLLLRFPNGQSPFGLDSQHGDATHVTALSRAKIEQYAAGLPLATHRYGGAARVRGRGVAQRVVRAVRYALRDMHMALLRFVYATDTIYEPVVTLVMRRNDTEAPHA
jgi:2-polyprenyl-3-methyl-5-hydroxy-6-metoxy-1,4-benzoquinol methylase